MKKDCHGGLIPHPSSFLYCPVRTFVNFISSKYNTVVEYGVWLQPDEANLRESILCQPTGERVTVNSFNPTSNFFQPVQKLVSKTRNGARTRRYYDAPQTPYQRLCAAGVLSPAGRAQLDALYASLNPRQLRRDIERQLERLWALAAPDPLRADNHTSVAPPLPKSSPGAS